ncbi:MAG: GSCFA domain-containing protein [Bacteroides sp.]|nr:GSCFA domain-containing protein [Roseburia sp.]MCM1346403.1 GSCFA domain-containing protein [Bacteroides sp.]MCM1420954.1 GSCFA domain-containing protein [Bacteroides sp.]
MDFTTKVDIRKSKEGISHKHKIMLIGSCFADNIGQKLTEAKFDCMANPFGTIYNPLSAARLLEMSLERQQIPEDSPLVFRADNGCWHSWLHHSRFSAETGRELCRNVNDTMLLVADRLAECDVLIVTFGTSIYYALKENDCLVANCHKQKDSLFVRRRMSPEEISARWRQLIAQLKEQNRNIRIIFTISPIRHKRDGLHANQLSKASLLLGVDALCGEFAGTADYFPAYEIVMDELRDYRFYADDMVHPSGIAVEYIWQRFCDTYFDRTTKETIRACAAISASVAHRPSNPQSEEYKRFILTTMDKIHVLKKKYPSINMEEELQICNTRLTK